jgi:hypothetical protein
MFNESLNSFMKMLYYFYKQIIYFKMLLFLLQI